MTQHPPAAPDRGTWLLFLCMIVSLCAAIWETGPIFYACTAFVLWLWVFVTWTIGRWAWFTFKPRFAVSFQA